MIDDKIKMMMPAEDILIRSMKEFQVQFLSIDAGEICPHCHGKTGDSGNTSTQLYSLSERHSFSESR